MPELRRCRSLVPAYGFFNARVEQTTGCLRIMAPYCTVVPADIRFDAMQVQHMKIKREPIWPWIVRSDEALARISHGL